MVGELYSAAFTAPAFNWLCSPACTELETVVLDWMGRALHLPAGFLADASHGAGGGVIQGSASEAIVTVMVAARERYLLARTAHLEAEPAARQAEIDRLRGRLVALGSEQAHSATHKAANICGTRHRAVPAYRKDGFAMRGETLRQVLKECEEEGLEPFYLTVGLGTTATCSSDAFEEITEVLKEWQMGKLWVHVDAAYAGAVLLLDEYKHIAKLMEPFDSFDVNMHKWMLVNFDAR
jgi:aromatic-L-amino-acid/L-tryptophan decarboxylase